MHEIRNNGDSRLIFHQRISGCVGKSFPARFQNENCAPKQGPTNFNDLRKRGRDDSFFPHFLRFMLINHGGGLRWRFLFLRVAARDPFQLHPSFWV